MSFRPAQAIFRGGDRCHQLYILAAGRVKCFRTNTDGREQILKIFERPGEMFCTTSAFSTGSHIVSAEAVTNATAYVIDVDTVKRLALEHPALRYGESLMEERTLRILHQAPGVFYCQLCLGRHVRISPHELDKVWADLVTDRRIEVAEGAVALRSHQV